MCLKKVGKLFYPKKANKQVFKYLKNTIMEKTVLVK